jgi:hypothetical protein
VIYQQVILVGNIEGKRSWRVRGGFYGHSSSGENSRTEMESGGIKKERDIGLWLRRELV